ncbi:MAG: c-type cytochrome, partial [Vicinamibacterales bacterium]
MPRPRFSVIVYAGALLLLLGTAADAQTTKPERSGEELYRFACAACHGADGTGAPQSQVGFDDPLPDFTDCSFNSPEAAADWFAVAHDGGPARAFSRRMPAFGGALTAAELERTVNYVRGFCEDGAWPRGDLNFPRALVTEKAFPENEALVTTAIQTGSSREVTNAVIYERRLGARSQWEVQVPLTVQAAEGSQWRRGLGDVAVAFKHVLFHSMNSGTIVSAAGEVVLPTGKESEGLGSGVMKFEPFIAAGQMLGSSSFVQTQAGAEIPRVRDQAETEAFWRGAVGTTFVQGEFGRSWTPIVELTALRELERGRPFEWDLVPQLQVSLSKRQHILVSGGVRIPLNER